MERIGAFTAPDVAYFTIPYACTISAWNITVNAGTVTFDIWKVASGTAVPTVANTITAAAASSALDRHGGDPRLDNASADGQLQSQRMIFLESN